LGNAIRYIWKKIKGWVLVLKILSIPFTETNMKETVSWADERIEKDLPAFIVTANPEIVMQANKNSDYHQAVSSADLITPDGIGIVYASRIMGRPLTERVAGYDMLHGLLKHREGKEVSTKVFLLGGTKDVVKAAGENLAKQYDHVQITGVHHGYFEKNSEEEKAIVKRVSREKPDLLLVGVGCPKQEEFIHRYRNQLNATVMIGVGGSFDILSGRICRAPHLFQKLGLEWFYRLLCDPRRIKRQMDLPIFAFLVIKERLLNGSAAVKVKTAKRRRTV
jgi:N-acetylglucosaminyldiphosphoundecaprenol N-acetyl-beta-D-mannosaminyltransferase